MENDYAISLPPLVLDSAAARAKAVLEQARAQVGFIPNMYANMANSPGLLETYLAGYRAFRAASGLTPAEQETVFLTISRENGCPYCVAAHSTLADTASKVPTAVTDAIRDDAEIPDARLAALAAFTRAMVATRGHPSREDGEAFVAAGYTERQVLEIVLAVAVKTLSNYSNHLFHTVTDPRFARRRWNAPADAGR